jgi:NAD(P)-dependent dehydrogenase (short-subunit alcohol dehydrogenase family)
MTFERLDTLSGKVAVITGGGQVATATAKRLSQQGARIYQLVRSNLDNVQAYLNTLPNGPHKALLADVTRTATIKEAVAQIDRCDILVNTAGRSRSIQPANVAALTDDIFDEIIITNIRGTFAVIREFTPLLQKTGDGLIVNITSTSGLRAGNSCVAYGSSKAAVDLMTKTLGKALAPAVRVVAIAPGFMVGPTSGAIKPPGANEKLAELSPLKRIGYADDIACSIEAVAMTMRFTNATTIVVDSGRTA